MMRYTILCVCLLAMAACGEQQNGNKKHAANPAALDKIMEDYWEERMQLFPMEATANGDNRYNDRLTITISESFRDTLKQFYNKYLSQLTGTDTAGMDDNHKMSYSILKYELEMNIEGMKYPTHYMPINQFWSLTLDLPQYGSGQGNQPFKTVEDYDDWLKRISVLPAWTDVAIANMRKGLETGWVLPEKLVLKILPQLKAMYGTKVPSVFLGPVNTFPEDFNDQDKERLKDEYFKMVANIAEPSYKKLHDFFEQEYLPKARKTTGVNSLPGGAAYYQYCIGNWTTTQLSPDSIYNIGLQQVEQITAEMSRIKDETGFKGDLKAFFDFLNTDKQFYPFSTAQQVLDSFWNIKKLEDPQLSKLFSHTPKTQFTIRQTEAFRAASASAEYNPGSGDGSRPGIFYVPILDPHEFNAVGMNTLFLHEAIPGHHYQISLAQENEGLPKFRRFIWYGAYGEGWALYSETLGKQLGLYDNPYQYFGHLSDAMHRAIRLVVDVGMHHKGMTRDEAIAYMVSHERISKEEATAEIERYMAIPGQALSYMIGRLTIQAERARYEQQLGDKFNIASFHDEVLKDGCVPLELLKAKLVRWAKADNN